MQYSSPPTNIYDKEFMLDDGNMLSIEIKPLSYSFTEHRARYKVFFSVESSDDYADGLAYLYEDESSLTPTMFIDDGISDDLMIKMGDIIEKDFIQDEEKPKNLYLIPDFS